MAARNGIPRLRAAWLLPAAVSLLLSACASFGGAPPDYAVGYTETGRASWYGPGFHGRRTASGEVYNQDALTAAHRTLPLGSVVEVTRRDTGHRVVVRITDRGPFVRGRILDLSRGAARRIQAIGPGVVPVRVRVMALPDDGIPDPVAYTVQLGRFADPGRAQALLADLGPRIPGLRLVSDGASGTVRVVTRPYTDYRHATRVANHIRRDLRPDAFVVREDLVRSQ